MPFGLALGLFVFFYILPSVLDIDQPPAISKLIDREGIDARVQVRDYGEPLYK
jgi:hypothetical protein